MINRAIGTLDPVIYFENVSGHIILPPTTAEARWIYSQKYSHEGYEWREAGTLAEVDRLQKRLVEAERRRDAQDLHRSEEQHARLWDRVGGNLRARMVSAATSEYEKEFIRLYMQLHDDEKRRKYEQRLKERNYYLVAREMDSGHSGAADLMHGEDGDKWADGV